MTDLLEYSTGPMIVKWTVSPGLWKIPERFWGEDLSLLDKHYEGEVMATHTDWWGDTFVTVACTDGKIRKIEIDNVEIITIIDDPEIE